MEKATPKRLLDFVSGRVFSDTPEFWTRLAGEQDVVEVVQTLDALVHYPIKRAIYCEALSVTFLLLQRHVAERHILLQRLAGRVATDVAPYDFLNIYRTGFEDDAVLVDGLRRPGSASTYDNTLLWAIEHKYADTFRCIAQRPDRRSHLHRELITLAMEAWKSSPLLVSVLESLCKMAGDSGGPSYHLITPAHFEEACRLGRADVVEWLADRGVPVPMHLYVPAGNDAVLAVLARLPPPVSRDTPQ